MPHIFFNILRSQSRPGGAFREAFAAASAGEAIRLRLGIRVFESKPDDFRDVMDTFTDPYLYTQNHINIYILTRTHAEISVFFLSGVISDCSLVFCRRARWPEILFQPWLMEIYRYPIPLQKGASSYGFFSQLLLNPCWLMIGSGIILPNYIHIISVSKSTSISNIYICVHI